MSLILLATIAAVIGRGAQAHHGADGTIETFAGNGFGNGDALGASLEPWDIDVDAAGNLYVAETNQSGRCQVRRVDSITNVVTTVAGIGVCANPSEATTAATSWIGNVKGIEVEGGDLYMTFGGQTGLCAVWKVTGGVLNRFAGQTGSCGESTEGAAPLATTLVNPVEIVAHGGDVYILDGTSLQTPFGTGCKIRKISGGVMTTVAGTGACAVGGEGTPATSTPFFDPQDLAIDAAGNLFIAEGGSGASSTMCRIRRVDAATSIVTTYAGLAGSTSNCVAAGDGGPATSATIGSTRGIDIDDAGVLYIGLRGGECNVRTVDVDGTIGTYASGICGELDVVASGDLFGGWLLDGEVRMYDGVSVSVAAGSGKSPAGTQQCDLTGDGLSAAETRFSSVQDVETDGADVLVLDSGNCRLRKVSGGVVTTVANDPKLCNASSIAVYGGSVYAGNGDLLEIAGGAVTQMTTHNCSADLSMNEGAPVANAATCTVNEIAVSASGEIYFSDPNWCRLRKISGGVVISVTGTGTTPHTNCFFQAGNGPALTMPMVGIRSITLSPGGDVYFSDNFCRVRRITASTGMIDTTIGDGFCPSLEPEPGVPPTLIAVNMSDLAFGPDGSLYLFDPSLCRVYRWSGGPLQRVAGSGVCLFVQGDGPALSVPVYSLFGLATDAASNLYLANARLRVLNSGPDADGDGAPNYADNCPSDANFTQANTVDFQFVVLTPFKAFNDLTNPKSDTIGDACDADDDNDGLTDGDEMSGAACSGAMTDPFRADSDGDRAFDSAECAIPGLDPNASAIAPSVAQCVALAGALAAGTDADADGIPAFRERCYYGTSDASANSDGDGCGDRLEIMSINSDRSVNSIDLGQIASEFGSYAIGAPPHEYNFDVTKDGAINAIDLGLVAAAFGNCL